MSVQRPCGAPVVVELNEATRSPAGLLRVASNDWSCEDCSTLDSKAASAHGRRLRAAGDPLMWVAARPALEPVGELEERSAVAYVRRLFGDLSRAMRSPRPLGAGGINAFYRALARGATRFTESVSFLALGKHASPSARCRSPRPFVSPWRPSLRASSANRHSYAWR